MPEFKQTFSKTFETPDGGLFCIARQGSAKGVFEPETATRSPAKRAYGVTLREGRHVVLWTTKVSEHLDGELAKAKLPGAPATTLKLEKPEWRPRSALAVG